MSTVSPYTIENGPQYQRKLRKFLNKHPDLRERYRAVVDALAIDPFAPALRLHALSGEHAGEWSASLTYSYRITLRFDHERRVITLQDIGDHEEVYGGGDDD